MVETAVAQHTVIDTNLTSAFMCAKAAYPIFKRGGGGSFAPAYAASKGGIVQLTRSLASAWIQANAVLPGWIDVAMGH